jgi:WG containing repeat
MAMAARVVWIVAALGAVLLAHAAAAQEQQPELTPAGKAALQSAFADDGRASQIVFPRATCLFRGGLCGAVRRDLTVAVPPRYDWVGRFSEGRAAVRFGGLYGFVDEEGREIAKPQYRIVGDYRFGFAQVDVDGKSGLIDRDGKMVIEPKYALVEAIGPDRFRVSNERRLWGRRGDESFPDYTRSRHSYLPAGGVIDISGRWIEPPSGASWAFDKDDPSIRWAHNDKLWGLQRTDGTWLVEPRFQQVWYLEDNGLVRVALHGKVGFIDRTGKVVIEPVFDDVWPFVPGLGRTSATRDGVSGVIDRTGTWVFKTAYEELRPATTSYPSAATAVVGWHFKKAGRWGLLDLDGRIVLDADFYAPIEPCATGGFVAITKELLRQRFKSDGSLLGPPNGQMIEASCTDHPPYALRIGDKFGLVDAEGNPVTPMHFEAFTWTGAQLKNAKIGGKWGRIAPDGRWVLEPKFDYLSTQLDLFVAAIEGKRGFMRADGSWLIEPRFDAARVRNAETAFVTIAGATGLMRLKDQSWVIAPRPGTMCDTDGGILSRADGKRAFLSPEGETWIDIDADRIGLTFDLGLLVFLRNGKWGLVDTAGQVMVEPQFDELDGFVRGIAWAKRGGVWCAIDRRGRAVPSISCTDAVPVVDLPRGPVQCKVES